MADAANLRMLPLATTPTSFRPLGLVVILPLDGELPAAEAPHGPSPRRDDQTPSLLVVTIQKYDVEPKLRAGAS